MPRWPSATAWNPRAKGLQNAVTDYLLSLDMMGALKRHNFTPALAAPLLADSLVQELTGQRMAQLREVARLVTGPALRGMAILDPRKFYNLAAATGHEPPLSEIGELIESLVKPQEEANHEPDPLQQAVQALISAASALLGQQDAQETPPQPASSPNQQESGATTPQNAIQDASAAVNQAASAQNGQNRPESGDSAIQGQTPAQAPATRNTGDSAMNQAASAQQSQYYAPAGPPAGVRRLP